MEDRLALAADVFKQMPGVKPQCQDDVALPLDSTTCEPSSDRRRRLEGKTLDLLD